MLVSLEPLVSLSKRRGVVFQAAALYGGLSATWDYGPIGVELKKNIKDLWWQDNVRGRDDVVGIDASILTHKEVLKASGHVERFHDLMSECKNEKCKHRFRIEAGASNPCPACGSPDVTQPREFNLLFKSPFGPLADEDSIVYLRPETAQGTFINFQNVINTVHPKLPFGIAQIGKSFRNEITTGNFIFRAREFEQMEMEYFVPPDEDMKYFDQWVAERFNWYVHYGLARERLRIREHAPDELAHYSKACKDIEYQFPFGWGEIEGIAHRGTYDLTKHGEYVKQDLVYPDEKGPIHPVVIEPAAGVDRILLAFLCEAYGEEKVNKNKRVVLKLHPALAPYKVAIFPLLANHPELVALAKKIYHELKGPFIATYDEGFIGKMYRRQDEIGTPYCITVDVESLSDQKVTIRDRDSLQQIRVAIDRVLPILQDLLSNHAKNFQSYL